MVREMKKLNVGLVGSSQLSFPGDKEGQFARSVKEITEMSKKLDFNLWVYPKTVITEEDAQAAAVAIEKHEVDFLLLQCTSYSSGFLLPIFAKIPDTWLGLWAVDETAEDGVVPLNSFCSINMYAGILGNYVGKQKRYKWFFGNAGNDMLDNRLAVTVRALTAIKNLRTANIGLIGGIAPGFNDLFFDERKLLDRFPGIKYNRLHEIYEITERAKTYDRAAVKELASRMAKETDNIHPAAAEMLETNASVQLAFKEFLEKNKYDALAVSCWPHFQQTFSKPFSVCSVVGQLNDDGVVTACEGDALSAVSMLMLKYIAKDTTMLMDLSAFDEKDETVLMWHCGPAAKCFAGKAGYTLGVNYTGLPHEQGKAPNCCGVARDMVFGERHVTIARLTGEIDQMLVAEGDFIETDKKSFFGSRGWMGGLKMNREKISARDMVNTILSLQFQHHYPIVGGDYSREVLEICAWLGISVLKKVEYQDYLQVE